MVFYSLGEGADKGVYYDPHPIGHMRHHPTMLAYDVSSEPLSFGHGAPLRLRNENELDFGRSIGSRASSSSPTTPRSAAAAGRVACLWPTATMPRSADQPVRKAL